MCHEVLIYLFFETEFHAIMSLYNTVHFLEFVLDLGTVKRRLVGCVCVCVRAVCKLTMQTIWDFQQFLIKRSDAVSLLNS